MPRSSTGKLAARKAREFSLVDKFALGYRNREDVTNLPPGVLIVGSQNVMTNVSERIQMRQGYSVDGAASSVMGPVLASFDWLPKFNVESHMRAGGLTSAGNDGKLQYRYVDTAGAVTWRDLTTALTTVAYNFTTYWNTTENLRETLFVNGTSNIFRWNGATAVVSVAGAASITKTGTGSWLDSGFYAVTAGDKKVIINGTEYTYTGGESTTTLTGVSPTPVAEAPGSIVHQSVRTTANSAMTGIPSTFPNALISTLNNQVFVGALVSPTVYISKVNNFIDYSGSTPRQTGEGAVLILDANSVAFDPQENFMYISSGQDQWYNINFELQTSTVGVTYEQVNAQRLKTGRRQGAISQAFVSHMKNNIIMATQETTIDTFGRIESSLATPQTVNISDPIKIDIDSYDFTDGSIAYWRYYILVALPQEGLVLLYNLANNSWEAPQTLPISRFYIVDGELYGHSYSSFESYKLFTGYADRVYSGFEGFPIQAVATFSYQNYGFREKYKNANYLYVEGYITPNTDLTATLTYELDGCATTRTLQINGDNPAYVCLAQTLSSLGKVSLGKQKLGGQGYTSINNLPPKFRVEKAFNNRNFFEQSCSFSCLGTNQRFEILAFGLNAGMAPEEPVKIRA